MRNYALPRIPPLGDPDDIAQYQGTPWLTGFANFCAVIGTFIGVYAVVGLLGYLHRGIGAYWPMILILALDVAFNALLQLLRFRRRRAEGLTGAERRRQLLEHQAYVKRTQRGR